MLMLRRKVGESILIGNGIEVLVIETRRGDVRLGVLAPKNIPIWRKEIIERDPSLIEVGGEAGGA